MKTNFFIENFISKKINSFSYLQSQYSKAYLLNAQADAIHCYQSIEKYLHKDKKILEVGGVFICLPVFYTKIMILLQLNPVVLRALPMNYAIKF
jgi:hypothetical protein